MAKLPQAAYSLVYLPLHMCYACVTGVRAQLAVPTPLFLVRHGCTAQGTSHIVALLRPSHCSCYHTMATSKSSREPQATGEAPAVPKQALRSTRRGHPSEPPP
eukprot:13700164-Ditylum_brightwellii.AAC.1